MLMSTHFCVFLKVFLGKNKVKEKHIYKRIKEIRKKHKLTQEEMSKKLKLYLTQYRRYETGETEIPAHKIIEICKIFNITSDYILELSDEYKELKKKDV